MSLTTKDKNKINKLIKKGYSANEIVKSVKKNRKETLKTIRELKNIPDKKDSKLRNTPIKYLNEEQKKKRNRVLSSLTKIDKSNINNLVREGSTNYKIIDLIGINKKTKTLKEIKKVKRTVKKEKIKSLKAKFPKCNYNYTTLSHIGYKFNRRKTLNIYKGISNKELNLIIKNLKDIVKTLKNKVRCDKRMNYLTIEYEISLQHEEKEKSRISSAISGKRGIVSFKGMINQIKELIIYLDNLVQVAQSPKHIKIYNIYYVNYDFKSSVNNENRI